MHYLKIQEGCVPAIVRHYKYFSYFYNWVHLKYYLLPKTLHSKCIGQNNYHLFWSHQNITQKTIRDSFFFPGCDAVKQHLPETKKNDVVEHIIHLASG